MLGLRYLIIVLQAPLSICRGNRAFYIALACYFLLGVVIFGVFAHLLSENEQWLKQHLLNYLLPQSWHGISQKLFNFFFESQSQIVIAGLIINGSLVLASIILFPLKEHVSYLFETSQHDHSDTPKYFPLLIQLKEECKLLFVYLAVQSVILAIGYYPFRWTTFLSELLSILFLCFTFSLDFISPTLQRHGVRYHAILKWLGRNIFLSLSFGALFAIPIVTLSQWLFTLESMDIIDITIILFSVNLVLFSLAIPAGTFVARHLLSKESPPLPHTLFRYPLYMGLSAALILSGGLHYLVAMSMHHKSQLLKCDYTIEWSSMDLVMPKLTQLISGEKAASLRFNLAITNPTPFDLDIENTQLSIWHNGKLRSLTNLTEIHVDSGKSILVPIKLDALFDLKDLPEMKQWQENWAAYLEVSLLPGIPFIMEVF